MSMMAALDEIKKKRQIEILANARRNRLAVKIHNLESLGESERAAGYLDLSLKVWDVLEGLMDIAGAASAIASLGAVRISAEALEAVEYAKQASFLASGSSEIMEALTLSEIMELAGPVVSFIALWVNLGSPYLEAKAEIQKMAAKRGIAHGIIVGCQGRKPHSARLFAQRQPGGVNNNWLDNATSVALQSYAMGFLAGYAQGHELRDNGRRIFWRIFGNTLKQNRVSLWNSSWDEKRNDDWVWEAGGYFQAKHLLE
jgi:hypothetical protein